MKTRRMSIEIIAEPDRKREAWLFAADREALELWGDRLWLSFCELTDYLNAVNMPVIIFPLTSKRNSGMVFRDTYWLTPATVPTPVDCAIIDTLIMEKDNGYLPGKPFENVAALKEMCKTENLYKWQQEKGLRIAGAYADVPDDEDVEMAYAAKDAMDFIDMVRGNPNEPNQPVQQSNGQEDQDD